MNVDANTNNPGPGIEAWPKAACTIEDVIAATSSHDKTTNGETRYTCQATELLNYSLPLKLKNWDVRQYVEDYQSKNASLRQLVSVLGPAVLRSLAPPRWLTRPACWLYRRLRPIHDWLPSPRAGLLRPGEPIPDAQLDLQPGEFVRVKSFDQILATINSKNLHRGMYFDVNEMSLYCGRPFRVRARLDKFIDERTGVMKTLKTPAVILEGVTCSGRHSENRWLCPRAILPWWREVWLERIQDRKDIIAPETERAA